VGFQFGWVLEVAGVVDRFEGFDCGFDCAGSVALLLHPERML